MKNKDEKTQAGSDCQERLLRPCVSWRQSGGFWSIHEDGEGERLRISNSVRDIELAELSDGDLEILQQLIANAIEFRKIHGPNSAISLTPEEKGIINNNERNIMETEIKTLVKIGAFVGKWPRLLNPKEVKEVETYVSEGRDPCPELIAKAEAIFDVNEMAKLERENAELKAEILRAELLVLQGSSGFERENAELRQRLATACDRIRDMLEGDDGQAWKEARTFLRKIGEPASIAEKKGGEV
jgi:hypothetical protein